MLKNLFVALTAVTTFAQAGGLPASKQVKLAITHVAHEGKVLSVKNARPYSKYTIEIPVTVNPGSACTHISGQKNIVENGRIVEIAVVGFRTSQICMAVMPRPVDMTVKYEMNILTGGFVPAQTIQKATVNLYGIGLTEVTLNMDNQVVTLKAAGHRPH